GWCSRFRGIWRSGSIHAVFHRWHAAVLTKGDEMTDKQFDIREVPSSDPANLLLAKYAFTTTPTVPDKEKDERYLQQRSDDRIFFSYVDNEPIARVGVIPMTQN